jgi:hypothetical protein
MSTSIGQLTAAEFKSRLGTRFRMRGGGAELEVELVDVSVLRYSGPEGSFRAPFQLILRAPSGPAWRQAIYQLVSDSFGAMAMFIVPARLDASGCYYCVTFN